MSLILNLPDSVEKLLREKAVSEGVTVESLAAMILASNRDHGSDSEFPAEMIDREFHTNCESVREEGLTLSEIRLMLASKMAGSLTSEIIEEREER